MMATRVGILESGEELVECSALLYRHKLPKYAKLEVFDTLFLRISINGLKY